MFYFFDFNKVSDQEILDVVKAMDKKRYKKFRQWLWVEKEWHTRNQITSLKPEYLREYYFEFIDQKKDGPNTRRSSAD